MSEMPYEDRPYGDVAEQAYGREDCQGGQPQMIAASAVVAGLESIEGAVDQWTDHSELRDLPEALGDIIDAIVQARRDLGLEGR